MTAITFSVNRQGHYVGAAVLCVEARYFSVMVPGVPTLARRAVSPAEWKLIAAEVAGGFSPQPLPKSSTIARLICDGDASAYAVQYLTQPTITATPETIAAVLDGTLRAVTP